ncbi:unnamed protein product, partial [Laminaria digitata]
MIQSDINRISSTIVPQWQSLSYHSETRNSPLSLPQASTLTLKTSSLKGTPSFYPTPRQYSTPTSLAALLLFLPSFPWRPGGPSVLRVIRVFFFSYWGKGNSDPRTRTPLRRPRSDRP